MDGTLLQQKGVTASTSTGQNRGGSDLLPVFPAFPDVVIRILLFVNRKEVRRIDFEGRTDFQNRGERWTSLTRLNETDRSPVETGEFGESFLGYLFGFSFFLDNFAKDLFSFRCH